MAGSNSESKADFNHRKFECQEESALSSKMTQPADLQFMRLRAAAREKIKKI